MFVEPATAAARGEESIEPGLNTEATGPERGTRGALLLDLGLYVAVMFLVREIYFPRLGFIANGLLWSLTCLAVASWRMRARGVGWGDLGLRRPESWPKVLLWTGGILVTVVASILVLEVAKELVTSSGPPEAPGADASSRFGDLAGNWGLFFLILVPVCAESTLEEMLDRGFLLSWLERIVPGRTVATALAVVGQAAIFGFRHSGDLSERSITTGLIGLVMGTAYVLGGRNLWPLIVAHCALNVLSMLERVL